MRWKSVLRASLGCVSILAACESGNPVVTGPVSDAAPDAAAACSVADGKGDGDDTSCKPLATDYMPRDNGSKNDTWPACISDDGAYHPFNPSVGSNARAAAFETIGKKLSFGGGRAPSPQDFLDARVTYTEPEGLDSRIVRREDVHWPAPPKKCADMTPDELAQWADRCVGPAKMAPLLNGAFQDGIAGKDPVRNAARIEAGLLWFFYVSAYKEANTCADTQADCDSATAYYAGTQGVGDAPVGLGRYLRSRSPQAHDRAWDGLLAVRCWRDLDNPTGKAQNDAMRKQATAQLDRALHRGVALVVRQRAGELPCEVAWETVRILGAALDREATARDATTAAVLRAEVGKASAPEVDGAKLRGAIDALFPCP